MPAARRLQPQAGHQLHRHRLGEEGEQHFHLRDDGERGDSADPEPVPVQQLALGAEPAGDGGHDLRRLRDRGNGRLPGRLRWPLALPRRARPRPLAGGGHCELGHQVRASPPAGSVRLRAEVRVLDQGEDAGDAHGQGGLREFLSQRRPGYQ